MKIIFTQLYSSFQRKLVRFTTKIKTNLTVHNLLGNQESHRKISFSREHNQLRKNTTINYWKTHQWTTKNTHQRRNNEQAMSFLSILQKNRFFVCSIFRVFRGDFGKLYRGSELTNFSVRLKPVELRKRTVWAFSE